jgi:hypothetical protein
MKPFRLTYRDTKSRFSGSVPVCKRKVVKMNPQKNIKNTREAAHEDKVEEEVDREGEVEDVLPGRIVSMMVFIDKEERLGLTLAALGRPRSPLEKSRDGWRKLIMHSSEKTITMPWLFSARSFASIRRFIPPGLY